MMNFGTKGCMYCEGECNKECLPKKETLEEAAENYINSKNPQWTPYHRRSFIDGAKWQQERMYSEEEVYELLNNFNKHTLKLQKLKLGNSFDVKDWFEQFKKK